MPVTAATNVVQVLDSVVIHNGGSVDVSVKFTAPGFPDILKTFYISEADALPIWGGTPSGTVSRWEDLCGTLYSILMERGDLTGTLS